jgi:hypothetical protein
LDNCFKEKSIKLKQNILEKLGQVFNTFGKPWDLMEIIL